MVGTANPVEEMTKTPRPSLTSLAEHMARKPQAEAAPPSAPMVKADGAPVKDGRVQVLVRMTPAERKALRQIALNQDTTVQALVEEAIRDLLRRHAS